MAKKTKKQSGGKVEDFLIDFSKEEKSSGGGRARYKPGIYPAKIISAKPVTSGNKGTPGLQIVLQFTDGKKVKGKKLTETLWASPKAYGRFRTLLEACEEKVPNQINLIKIAKTVKGSELAVEIDDEASGRVDDKGKEYPPSSRVTFEGFLSLEDYGSEEDAYDDEDEKPKKKKRGDSGKIDKPSKKSKVKDEPAPKKKAKKGKKTKVDDDDIDLSDF